MLFWVTCLLKFLKNIMLLGTFVAFSHIKDTVTQNKTKQKLIESFFFLNKSRQALRLIPRSSVSSKKEKRKRIVRKNHTPASEMRQTRVARGKKTQNASINQLWFLTSTRMWRGGGRSRRGESYFERNLKYAAGMANKRGCEISKSHEERLVGAATATNHTLRQERTCFGATRKITPAQISHPIHIVDWSDGFPQSDHAGSLAENVPVI